MRSGEDKGAGTEPLPTVMRTSGAEALAKPVVIMGLADTHSIPGGAWLPRRGPGPREEFLREASEQVRPVHAEGTFYMGYGVLAYYLLFEYYDPLGYYDAVVRDERLLEEEVAKLQYNMQSFIDQEEVIVNGVRVRPKVVLVDIAFRGRRSSPMIIFGVRAAAPVKPGRNVYENRFQPERAEYDYVAYWMFPPGSRIVEVDMGGEEWEVTETGVLAVYGRRGRVTGGYEKIVVELPPVVAEEQV